MVLPVVPDVVWQDDVCQTLRDPREGHPVGVFWLGHSNVFQPDAEAETEPEGAEERRKPKDGNDEEVEPIEESDCRSKESSNSQSP